MPKLAVKEVADVCEVDFVDERKVKRVQQVMKTTEAVGTLAETFKLLGDPTGSELPSLFLAKNCVSATSPISSAFRSQRCRTPCARSGK